MKKYCALFIGILFAVCSVSAQDLPVEEAPVDTSVRVIVPKDQHTPAAKKTANIKIEYIPLADEVRIYYNCLDVEFDQGEAMNTILACLKDFQAENQYYGFTYLSSDKTRYYKDSKNIKWASYMSYVKYSR